MVLSVMLRESRPLSELAEIMTPVPQVILNKNVERDSPNKPLVLPVRG